MGAVAIISVSDQNNMNSHISALMLSGRRLRQITISPITACFFRYRRWSSLKQRTAACWRKSGASQFNLLHLKENQSSGNGATFLFTAKQFNCFIFTFLVFFFFPAPFPFPLSLFKKRQLIISYGTHCI